MLNVSLLTTKYFNLFHNLKTKNHTNNKLTRLEYNKIVWFPKKKREKDEEKNTE